MSEYRLLPDTGGVKVEVWVKKLPLRFQKTLKTYIGSAGADTQRNILVSGTNIGLVENVVMLNALEKVHVNDKKVDFDNDEGDPLAAFPEIDDDDEYTFNVDDALMRAICAVNPILYRHDRFAQVFRAYAPPPDPERDEPEEDPTDSPAALVPAGSSTDGRSSITGTLPLEGEDDSSPSS